MHPGADWSSGGTHELLLQFHQTFLTAARHLYAPDVHWSAPARGIEKTGRDEVLRHLLREASAMREPEFTFLRRGSSGTRIIDEFSVRFLYAGEGLDNAPLAAGDLAELKRVRILELEDGKVRKETCVENWTVLERSR